MSFSKRALLLLVLSTGWPFASQAQERSSTPPVFQPKCGDIPVQSIDLSRQFGPTKCQGFDQICYAYGLVAGVEAALYRADGTLRVFNERATLLAQQLHESSGRRGSAEIVSRIERKASSEQGSGNAALSGPGRTFDFGFFKPVFEFIQKTGTVSRVTTDSPEGQEVQSLFTALAAKHANQDALNSEAWLGLMNDAKILKSKGYLTDSSEKELLKKLKLSPLPIGKNGQAKFQDDCSWTGANRDYFHNMSKAITTSLCQAVPVLIGLDVRGLRARAGTRVHEPSAPNPLAHAAVIVGLEKNEQTQEWEFIIRDSAFVGSKESPMGSDIRLPLSKLCQVGEMHVIRGPWDGVKVISNEALRCAETNSIPLNNGRAIRCGVVTVSDEKGIEASSQVGH